MTWYYVKQGRRYGPVDEENVRALLLRNEIHGNTRVWRKGMDEWRPAKEVAPGWFQPPAAVATAVLPQEAASPPKDAGSPPAQAEGPPEPVFDNAVGAGVPGVAGGHLMCSVCGTLAEQDELTERDGGLVCASCVAAIATPAPKRRAVRGGKVGSVSELWHRLLEDHFRESLLIGVTLLCAIGMILSWRLGKALDFPLRLAASTSYMLVALACGAFETKYGKATLLGLFCCWIGSLALGIIGGGTLQVGLGAYIAGHCLFAAAFWMRGVPQSYYPKGFGALLIGAGALMGYVALFGVEGPWRAFGIVLAIAGAATAAVAYGARQGGGLGTLAFAGAMTLLFADACILHIQFVKPSLVAGILGIFAYYAALMMLAFSTAYEYESATQQKAPTAA